MLTHSSHLQTISDAVFVERSKAAVMRKVMGLQRINRLLPPQSHRPWQNTINGRLCVMTVTTGVVCGVVAQMHDCVLLGGLRFPSGPAFQMALSCSCFLL